MGALFRGLIAPVLKPILKPLTRFVIGLIAIPLFRLFMRRVVRLQELDEELEKDLEEWFRGSILLFFATHNMEDALFGWLVVNEIGDLGHGPTNEWEWLLMAFRILLAIGVIESMPDQELFSIIHPGPPKPKWEKARGIWGNISDQWKPILKGSVCQHLNRSSPVLAIMAAIVEGWIGWLCYGLAIAQYLIIGLVTSRDAALDILSDFDREVAIRRREIIKEFHIDADHTEAPLENPLEVHGPPVPEGWDEKSD